MNTYPYRFIIIRITRFLSALPLFFISFSAFSIDYSAVERTWFYGDHAIPSAISIEAKPYRIPTDNKNLAWTNMLETKLIAEKKVPAVLYLHGCRGISADASITQAWFLSEGYAFFMPDSFKRPGRLACRQQGDLSSRVSMRKKEIKFAYSEIKKLNWIDQENIILMGFSEGGNAVGGWNKLGFRAHIIISSACTLSWGGKPKAPQGVEVLAVVGEEDDYRPGKSCKIKHENNFSQSIVLPNEGHAILGLEETKNIIREFIHKL
jgi:dienelactone hydrolase